MARTYLSDNSLKRLTVYFACSLAFILICFFSNEGIRSWSSQPRQQYVKVKSEFRSAERRIPFNNPPGVDIWCGKAYRAGDPSFDPGGRLDPPAYSPDPLLDLRVYSRMSIYTEDDSMGSFIVEASLSHTHGQPFCETSMDAYSDRAISALQFSITNADTGAKIISDAMLNVNTTSNEFQFQFQSLPAGFDPYNITIQVDNPSCDQVLEAETQIYRLPSRSDGGSVTRVDRLYGGLLVQNTSSEPPSWQPLFPYSFYVNWGGYLEASLDNVAAFKDLGYNIIHPIPDSGSIPFPVASFEAFLDKCDELGLWVMYDMRWTYQNLPLVTEQVDRIKSRKSLLLWYSGDEPDGHGDPLNATVDTYDRIKSLDPYHPVSLALNCYNFYYSNYSAGADIVLSDVYSIATNTSFSTVYNTVCNSTYGCCGCDDCNGDFLDVSTRLDRFQLYQSWLGAGPKTFWGTPQVFGGSEFWTRAPTAKEEVVMVMLSLNHNAKGIVGWSFPTTDELTEATSELAKVLTSSEVTMLLLGANPVALPVSEDSGFDVAGWRVGNKMLLSLVHLDYDDFDTDISLELPLPVEKISLLWTGGQAFDWEINDDVIRKNGVGALEVQLLSIDLKGEETPEGGSNGPTSSTPGSSGGRQSSGAWASNRVPGLQRFWNLG